MRLYVQNTIDHSVNIDKFYSHLESGDTVPTGYTKLFDEHEYEYMNVGHSVKFSGTTKITRIR